MVIVLESLVAPKVIDTVQAEIGSILDLNRVDQLGAHPVQPDAIVLTTTSMDTKVWSNSVEVPFPRLVVQCCHHISD